MKGKKSTLKMAMTLLIFLIIISLTSIVSVGVQESPSANSEVTYDEDPGTIGQTGSIYGYTYVKTGWGVSPLPFVHIKVENKSTYSNLYGYYYIGNLPVDQVYEVTASKLFYRSETEIVELTSQEPDVEVDFILSPKTNNPIVSEVNSQEISGTG